MAHLGVCSAGRTVHTWALHLYPQERMPPMASNTSLSQQVEGSGTAAKSTTTSDTGKDILPFPRLSSTKFWE